MGGHLPLNHDAAMHPSTDEPSAAPRRAVVLGAGFAGLLAARALAGHFDEVLLLARRAKPACRAPDTPSQRLPAGGQRALEQLFPGFTQALRSRGAPVGHPASIAAEVHAGVLALPGVRLLGGVQAIAPRCDAGRVTAARWRCLHDDREHEASAALVVDCTGRGSHTPRWLNDWGYGAPVEERMEWARPRRAPAGATQPSPWPIVQRRHYARLRHLPAGLLVMGDAIASLGPLCSHGMALAACQAQWLQAELARGEPGLARRFFRQAAHAIELPWHLARAGAAPTDAGPAGTPLVRRLADAYLRRLHEAAARDEVLSAALQRTLQEVDGWQALWAPAIAWRVLRPTQPPAAAWPRRALP